MQRVRPAHQVIWAPLVIGLGLAASGGAAAEDPPPHFLEPFPDVLAAAGLAPAMGGPVFAPSPFGDGAATEPAEIGSADDSPPTPPRPVARPADLPPPSFAYWADGLLALAGRWLPGLVPEAPVRVVLVVEPGDTLAGLITEVGMGYGEAVAAAEVLAAVWDPHALRVGQEVALSFVPAKGEASPARLQALGLQVAYDRSVGVERADDGALAAFEAVIDYTPVVRALGGTITSSLFVDGNDAGIPIGILVQMARPLSFDVDFQRSIQPGDTYAAMWTEEHDDAGAMVATGDLLFASLVLSGEAIEIYRFEGEDGFVDYYTPEGNSVRKALMRTPIDAARISSGFGMRNHPVLGYSRMHTGVDFAAGSGTPILAAGNGTVELAGRNGGYGNYVRIRHNSEFQTAYAHMSRFADGIQSGTRVTQGQVIGYVGSTGMSTGPHLHFEVLRNGAQVNPLTIDLPNGEPLRGADLARFQVYRAALDSQLMALLTGAPQGALAQLPDAALDGAAAAGE